MRKLLMLIAMLLCLSVPVMFVSCAKKEAEKKAEPEKVEEPVEEADTTVAEPDTL
ncbi:MAG: hypothetical protein ONB05_04665 [candidate division KSB1 bacterium]|nr:hypothetical protein [candidate division KSB1 bacterium]